MSDKKPVVTECKWPIRMWTKKEILSIYGNMDEFREDIRKGADHFWEKAIENIPMEKK